MRRPVWLLFGPPEVFTHYARSLGQAPCANGPSKVLRSVLILLSEFDKPYVTQRSIKGQGLADHLAEHKFPDVEALRTDLPPKKPEEAEWTLYFAGTMNGDEN